MFTGVVRVTSLSLYSAIFIVIPGHYPRTCETTPIYLPQFGKNLTLQIFHH